MAAALERVVAEESTEEGITDATCELLQALMNLRAQQQRPPEPHTARPPDDFEGGEQPSLGRGEAALVSAVEMLELDCALLDKAWSKLSGGESQRMCA